MLTILGFLKEDWTQKIFVISLFISSIGFILKVSIEAWVKINDYKFQDYHKKRTEYISALYSKILEIEHHSNSLFWRLFKVSWRYRNKTKENIENTYFPTSSEQVKLVNDFLELVGSTIYDFEKHEILFKRNVALKINNLLQEYEDFAKELFELTDEAYNNLKENGEFVAIKFSDAGKNFSRDRLVDFFEKLDKIKQILRRIIGTETHFSFLLNRLKSNKNELYRKMDIYNYNNK